MRFAAANDTSVCLVAPGTAADAWVEVGPCAGKRAEWRQIDKPQLESMAFPGSCLNVFGGPPACCPGGAHSHPTKFHITSCGWGPGNRFKFDADGDGHGNITMAGASKWSACADLCAAPTAPLVSLRPCTAATQWTRVPVPDADAVE